MLEAIGVIGALAGLSGTIIWLIRRFSPPITCPRCGSDWLEHHYYEAKQCKRCGNTWYY